MLIRHGCGLPYYSSCTLPKSHSHDGFMQVSPSHQHVDPHAHFRGMTWRAWNNLSSLGGDWGELFQERLPRRLRWVSQNSSSYAVERRIHQIGQCYWISQTSSGFLPSWRRPGANCHPVCASLHPQRCRNHLLVPKGPEDGGDYCHIQAHPP